jgi:hypothetical protein
MANEKKCAERTFEKKHLQLAETRHIRKGNVSGWLILSL